MLNVNEFCILDIMEDDDTIYYMVEKTDKPDCCPCCGGAVRIHSKRDRIVKDLPVDGKKVILRIIQKRYLCKSCKHTFWESLESVGKRDKITKRLKKYIINAKDTCMNISQEVGISHVSVARNRKGE